MVVRPGHGTRDEKHHEPIVTLESEQPPILVHPSHLGGALAAGQIFNIGVRIKTKRVSILWIYSHEFRSTNEIT